MVFMKFYNNKSENVVCLPKNVLEKFVCKSLDKRATDAWCVSNCQEKKYCPAGYCSPDCSNGGGSPPPPPPPPPHTQPDGGHHTGTQPAGTRQVHTQPANSSSGGPYYGGWCMGTQCVGWIPPGANTICAGNFKSLNSPPPDGKQLNVPNKWMTVGGENVGGTLPSAQTLIQQAKSGGYNGVDFDMEGALDGKSSEVNEIMKDLKAAGLHTQATVFGSHTQNISLFPNADTFGLMLYGVAMNGSGWGIPPGATADNPSGETWGYIKQWIDSPSVNNSKIILGMTAYTGGGLTEGMVDFFKGLVKKYKLGGILFWPGNADKPSSNSWIQKASS